jgi:hypothetical protein
MSEMIERVARVLQARDFPELAWEDCDEASREEWRQEARAVIEAMRKPTEEMRRAFHNTSNCVLDEAGFAVPIWGRQWASSIDAALSPVSDEKGAHSE